MLVYDDNGITVYFADNPNGADDYELVISFGKEEGRQGEMTRRHGSIPEKWCHSGLSGYPSEGAEA